jgi:predicted nuclease with TOPRIM domain
MGNYFSLLEDYKRLSATNFELNNKLTELENEINRLKVGHSISPSSVEEFEDRFKESVEKLVNDMLENDNINSSLIPDYIERKIYMNVFKMLISIMKETIDSTSINLLNHNITFNMTPREKN